MDQGLSWYESFYYLESPSLIPFAHRIKAQDPSIFAEVIEIANRTGKHDELVKFLQMARKTLREPKIDTELAYVYC